MKNQPHWLLLQLPNWKLNSIFLKCTVWGLSPLSYLFKKCLWTQILSSSKSPKAGWEARLKIFFLCQLLGETWIIKNIVKAMEYPKEPRSRPARCCANCPVCGSSPPSLSVSCPTIYLSRALAWCWERRMLATQLCLTPSDPMDCSHQALLPMEFSK